MAKLTEENFKRENIEEAIKDWTHKEQVELGLFCAELVLPYYSGLSPAPQSAINAVKKWLLDTSKSNADACDDLYVDTWAAAAYPAHYTVAAVHTASNADNIDSVSSWTASAAWAAEVKVNEEEKHQIINYINNKG